MRLASDFVPFGRPAEAWHPPIVFDARRHLPNVRANLRRIARWWELEAMRGYESSERSRQYGANYRWLVEMYDAGRFSVRKLPIGSAVFIDDELASKHISRAQAAIKEQS